MTQAIVLAQALGEPFNHAPRVGVSRLKTLVGSVLLVGREG
jgi:hypothetical protein